MSPDVLGQTGSRQGADHISTVRGGLASGSSDQREEAAVGLWHQKRWRQRDTRQRQRQRDRETTQKQDVRADLVSSPHLEQPPAQAAGPTCGSSLDWTLTWPHLLVTACIKGHRRNHLLSACLPSLAGRIVHPAAEALLHWWEPTSSGFRCSEDQQFPRVPPGLQRWIGTAETSCFWSKPLSD